MAVEVESGGQVEEFLRILRRRAWWILLPASLCIAIGTCYSVIVPKKYAWKGSKWIKKIEFLSHDRRGFWEERGYSNTAEPWYNDRYDVSEQKIP